MRLLDFLKFGGPGSGCHGDNCGRPAGSGSTVASTRAVRNSEDANYMSDTVKLQERAGVKSREEMFIAHEKAAEAHHKAQKAHENAAKVSDGKMREFHLKKQVYHMEKSNYHEDMADRDSPV